MQTSLKWFAAILFAGLAWLVVQFQSEQRWANQKIPMKHLNR